jgi:recombination protein RecR
MNTLSQLIEALRCLPGVGPKSAQRMAFHLLHQQRQRGLYLAQCLEKAMRTIQHCSQCNNYTEEHVCALCQQHERDQGLLCVVETPADVLAIEQTQLYRGFYYVLMGKISPLDGIGPDDIALPGLTQQIHSRPINEVILALSPTIEGQTTIHFIQAALRDFNLTISQLAHGIPMGGELEFLNTNTIGSALRNRAAIQ